MSVDANAVATGTDGGDAGDAGDGQQSQQTTTKTYTKAEVDAIRNKAVAQARKDFGDYGELKAKAEEFDKLQESSKSETEKERARADRAIRERDQALTRAQNSLIRSAIISAASKLGAVDPEAVAALLPHDEVVLEGDEVIGADEAVKALLAKKPYLRGANARTAAGNDLGGQGGEPTIITRTQIRQWAKAGQLTDERQKQILEAQKAGRVLDR